MAKTPNTAAPKDEWDEGAAIVQKAAVKVRCIVHTLPHTGLALPGAKGLGLRHGEVVEVPEDVALAMHAAGQVEIQ